MSLGVQCDRSHKHTKLEGWYTSWSAAYHWDFCRKYARSLASAPKWLTLLHQGLPVVRVKPGFKRISSLALTGSWPDIPLCYLAGDMESARQQGVVFGDELHMAPAHGSDGSGSASGSAGGPPVAASAPAVDREA